MDNFDKACYTSASEPKNRQLYGAAKEVVAKVLGFVYDCTYPWRMVLPFTGAAALLLSFFYAMQPGFDGDYARLALAVVYLTCEWSFYLGSGLAVLTVLFLIFRR